MGQDGFDILEAGSSGAAVSVQALTALRSVGENVRTARLRRRETEAVAAARIGVARSTWRRLEAGSPKVAMGAYAQALLLYGFAEQLFALGDPHADPEAVSYTHLTLPTTPYV